MKKTSTWMLVSILICCTAALLSSCKDKEMQDVVDTASLIGTWEYSKTRPTTSDTPNYQGNVQGIITFEADGTFHENNGKRGRWTFRNKELAIYYPNGEGRSMKYVMKNDGFSQEQIILEANFIADDGCTYTCSLMLHP